MSDQSAVEEWEEFLGPSESFILTSVNRPYIKRWAIAKGLDPIAVHNMTGPQLTNLYHEYGPGSSGEFTPPAPPAQQPTATQLDQAALTIRIVQAIGAGMTGEQALRSIISEEIPTAETLRALAKEVYDGLPPRKLEVSGPQGVNLISGAIHFMTQEVIKVAALGHPIMLVGPAGCGKTTIGEHCARALGLPFFITSTVMDTHELMGFTDGYGKYHSTPFRQAFEFGGVWVADEIDAWDAAALLTANSALANGFATFPDATAPIRRHEHFRMVATANTFGHGADRVYIGRNELDAASLDRFATIEVDYDTELERQFCNGQARWLHRVWEIRKKVQEKNIRHVVSSRAIIMGAAALNAGLTQDRVESMYLWKGMSKTDREKVR